MKNKTLVSPLTTSIIWLVLFLLNIYSLSTDDTNFFNWAMVIISPIVSMNFAYIYYKEKKKK